jgi:hypothetical protein
MVKGSRSHGIWTFAGLLGCALVLEVATGCDRTPPDGTDMHDGAGRGGADGSPGGSGVGGQGGLPPDAWPDWPA